MLRSPPPSSNPATVLWKKPLWSYFLVAVVMFRTTKAWLSSTARYKTSLQRIGQPYSSSLSTVTHNGISSDTSYHRHPTVSIPSPSSSILFHRHQNNFQSTRLFSSNEWKVPSGLYIPEDQLEFSFVRSSGAGGQNVNKVNSQVQIKLKLVDNPGLYQWVPKEVVERLKQQQSNRINKQNELVLSSQEHRSQARNREEAVTKLRELILQAWARPKVRKLRTKVSKQTKEKYKDMKKRRSDIKQSRRKVDF